MTDQANEAPAEGAGELLPCPFCGGAAEIVHFEDGENEGGSCVCCTVCQASGNVEFERKENFVSNWNRRARSSAPEAREGEAVGQVNALYASGFGRMRCIEWTAGDMPEVGTKLYTHPAAPSADKLRIAREALEKAKTGYPVLRNMLEVVRLSGGVAVADEHIEAIDQVLAALKAEGA